ncbi:MAG: hypothetical protein ACI4PO_08355 [Faecousia sp.]
MMCNKIRKYWDSLDKNVTVSKRELLLGVTCCTLAGILTGMLLSPKKSVTIGSNNGSNNSGNSASLPAAEDEASSAEGE